MVGLNLQTTISNSHATGDVTASHNTVGGLVGSNYDDLAWTTTALPRNAISGSTASGTVTTTGNFVGGLVGWNNGTISDSAARNPSVTGAGGVGGLVGLNNDNQADGSNAISGSTARGIVTATGNNVGGLVGWNNGPISDSAALNLSVTGAVGVGGLVGSNSDAQADGSNAISGSTARGTVTATGNLVGGLVGWNNGPISDSAALNPSVTGVDWVGGLVGTNTDEQVDGSNAISGSTARGTVTGGENVGGLAGWSDGPISDSAALNPSVTGTIDVGGLVGQTAGGMIDRSIATANVAGTVRSVGGLVGFNTVPIRDSYASGAVQGANSPDFSRSIGGLVGANHGGQVINSRADGDVSVPVGQGDSIGGLVGDIAHGSVTGSIATGAVTGTSASASLGGLVGQNGGSISGSAATGAVSGGQRVGGLVGWNRTATSSVTESWASGDVSANTLASVSESGREVGGLAGWNGGTVGASFATGNVLTGFGPAGGLIGRNVGTVVATYATGNVTVSDMPPCTGTGCFKDAGGLIGLAGGPGSGAVILFSTVQASYSTGMVNKVSGSSTYSLGGLAGTGERDAGVPANNAVFTNSYWDTETSGETLGVASDDEDANGLIDGTETATAGVTGQTTTALNAPTDYTGIFAAWNVTIPMATARTGGPWDFGGPTDYPLLRGLGAPPSFPAGTATLSVAEERAAGTSIGSPLTATDADSNTLTYKLIGADGSYFGINGMTGQLSTKTLLDYENPLDGDRDNTYEFMVQASDGMTVAFWTVSVRVTDAIDNSSPPMVTGSEAVTVAENSTAVATYAAHDPDGLASTFTWSLAGTDAGAFSISAGGVLTFDPAPNFEAPTDTGSDNIYEVTVQADDGGMTSEPLAVLVTVEPVDEPPVIDGDASVTIDEAVNPYVGNYFATDPEGSDVSWETLAGPDAGYFAFDRGTLEFIDTPDYEARASKVYQVTVRAVDETSNVGELTVTVTLTNVNEAPAISGPATIDVDEGHTGTLGMYGTDDPELSLTNWGTFGSAAALSGPDAGRFRFDKETGRLTFAVPPDFERGGGEYQVTLSANDSTLDSSLAVTITVANVEERGTLTLDMRQPVVGRTITATLTDPDAVVGGSATWTWRRSTSRSGGGTEIATATSRSYTPVTDDVGHYLTATATYEDGQGSDNRTLQAVTEFTTAEARSTPNAAPVLPDTVDAIELPESALPGGNVGAPVQATDADDDPITYSLSRFSDTEFVIDQSTGQIKVAPDTVFDSDASRDSYTVTVVAADGFGASDTVGVTIKITNVAEPPVAQDDHTLFDEDTAIEIDVLDNDSDPEDAKSALTVSVVRRPARGMVVVNDAVDPDRPTITYTPQANYSGADSFTYQVSDTDGLASNVATVALNGLPANDAPEFPPSETGVRSVSEQAQHGDPVGAPVTATDPDGDGDVLYYTLTDSSNNFKIDSGTAQITVSETAALDATNEPTHMVTVTAADEAGATASIDVTITVTTGPVITPAPNNAPTFASHRRPRAPSPRTPPAATNVGTYSASPPRTSTRATYSRTGSPAPTRLPSLSTATARSRWLRGSPSIWP